MQTCMSNFAISIATSDILTDPQYFGSEARDLSTTPDIERWRSLRTLFRGPEGSGANDQVKYDRFNWKLEPLPQGCTFTYADDVVKITLQALT